MVMMFGMKTWLIYFCFNFSSLSLQVFCAYHLPKRRYVPRANFPEMWLLEVLFAYHLLKRLCSRSYGYGSILLVSFAEGNIMLPDILRITFVKKKKNITRKSAKMWLVVIYNGIELNKVRLKTTKEDKNSGGVRFCTSNGIGV